MKAVLAALSFSLAAALSVGVCTAMSLTLSWASGWRALARRYRTSGEPGGVRFSMQSGRVGVVDYNRCLTVGVSAEGLYLAMLFFFRVGQPPLLIPWSDLTVVAIRDRWYARDITLRVGDPLTPGELPVARLRLPLRVARAAEAMRAALPESAGDS
jgi:hypothetical protein